MIPEVFFIDDGTWPGGGPLFRSPPTPKVGGFPPSFLRFLYEPREQTGTGLLRTLAERGLKEERVDERLWQVPA